MQGVSVFYQGHGISQFEEIVVERDHTIAMVRAAIMQRHGLKEGLLLFVEEKETPLGDEVRIETLCVATEIKMHVSHCEKVAVSVAFAGQVVHHTFSPARTVGAVKRWAAIEKFGMSEAEASEHQLQIAGTKDRPPVGTHIGTLTHCPECKVRFDVVPDERVNGASRTPA